MWLYSCLKSWALRVSHIDYNRDSHWGIKLYLNSPFKYQSQGYRIYHCCNDLLYPSLVCCVTFPFNVSKSSSFIIYCNILMMELPFPWYDLLLNVCLQTEYKEPGTQGIVKHTHLLFSLSILSIGNKASARTSPCLKGSHWCTVCRWNWNWVWRVKQMRKGVSGRVAHLGQWKGAVQKNQAKGTGIYSSYPSQPEIHDNL